MVGRGETLTIFLPAKIALPKSVRALAWKNMPVDLLLPQTTNHSIFSKTNFALECLPWCTVGGTLKGNEGGGKRLGDRARISGARVLNHVERIRCMALDISIRV